jgi:hypothetical protein
METTVSLDGNVTNTHMTTQNVGIGELYNMNYDLCKLGQTICQQRSKYDKF